MKQYLDAGNGTISDIVNMANRYDRFARQLPEDSEERVAAAREGLKYIDQAIERVPNNATVYRIKGQLLLSAEGGQSEALATAFQTMLDLLDADPENKTKQAGSYATGYYFLGSYAASTGDKPKAIEYFTKYLELRPEDNTTRATLESLSK